MPTKNLQAEVFWNLLEILPRSQKLRYSEGAVFHNVLYYKQLSIACYQVSFYANNCFEQLPVMSSVFKAQSEGTDPCLCMIPVIYFINNQAR